MRLFSLFLLLFSAPVLAQTPAPLIPSPPTLAAKAWVLLDWQTRQVLVSRNPDERVEPASLTKLMTAYLVFDALKQKRIAPEQTIPVSERAWKADGSRMFIEPRKPVTADELIKGMVVQSGNDATIALAEAVGGSEEAFADLMNKQAARMGLTGSHFVNSTGLPDPQHYSTARDLGVLAADVIRDFPEYYHYFAELTFVHNGIEQGNRNPLLYRNMGVDGLKTGHLTVSGYGLAASALRNGRRVVVVAHGMESMQARADEVAKLIEWAYREFDNYKLAAAGDVLENAPVWLGEAETVPMVLGADLVVTLPRGKRETLEARAVLANAVPAPIAAGQPIGMLIVTMPGMAPLERPLLAGADVAELGMFGRVMAAIRSLLFSDETEAVGA